ncbi:hypothetical protein KEM55_001443, partial [Ascosphaera atra]
MEFQQIKQIVYEFQQLRPDDEKFLPILEYVIRLVNGLIESEETNLAYPIEHTISAEESRRKAKAFKR